MTQKGEINSELLKFIRSMKKGSTFTTQEFNAERGYNASELSHILSALVEQRIICKLSKGLYMKPTDEQKKRRCQLSPEELFHDFLWDEKKNPIGYLTGDCYLRSIGVFVESNEKKITIGVPVKRGNVTRNGVTCLFVHQKEPINTKTIEMLQILDVLKRINEMRNPVLASSVYEKLRGLVMLMPPVKVDRLVKLSLGYNRMTKALVGTIIEKTHGMPFAAPILISMNSSTRSFVNISPKCIPNASGWNIICADGYEVRND